MSGRGHIHRDKRTGSYWLVINEVDSTSGKRRRRWIGPHRLKKEAERKRVEVLAAVDRGDFVEPSKLKVGQFLTEQWLPSKRDQVRPSTLRGYEGYIRNYLVPRLGAIPLQQLGPADIAKLYTALGAGGRVTQPGRSETDLSPVTVRRVHAVLHQALGDAMRWGLITRNAAAAVRPPRVASKPEMKTWDAAELSAFLDFVAADGLFALWRLFAVTGVRRSEALGLRWCDVEWDNGSVTINQALVVNGYSTPIFSAPKTAAGARTIDLDATTIAALRAHRVRQGEQRLSFGPGWRHEFDLVFADGDGGPLLPGWVSSRFEAHVRRSGLKRIRLHDLRHTWASLALRASVHPRVVQERLGHSTIAITLGTYSHLSPGMGKEAGDRVAGLLR